MNIKILPMTIHLDKLEELGWRFHEPLTNANVFTKDGRYILVNNVTEHKKQSYSGGPISWSEYENEIEAKSIFTRSGRPKREIESLDDLEFYYSTGK